MSAAADRTARRVRAAWHCRALLQFDVSLRGALKAEGFLTRDPRMRERKKYGQRVRANGSNTRNVNCAEFPDPAGERRRVFY